MAAKVKTALEEKIITVVLNLKKIIQRGSNP